MNNTALPKMTKAQARLLWKSLTWEQKQQFNDMFEKLNKKELILTNVIVDDNEQIQRIVLDDKNKKGKPDKPFYEHFNITEEK